MKGKEKGEAKPTGRPPLEVTDQMREMVKELASLGTRHADICRFVKNSRGVPICVDTLVKHFGEELELGRIEANARVAATLYKMAVSGDSPASTFFWLKTRARWSEAPQQVAFTDPEGNPVQPPSLSDFYATVAKVVRPGEQSPEASSGDDGGK